MLAASYIHSSYIPRDTYFYSSNTKDVSHRTLLSALVENTVIQNAMSLDVASIDCYLAFLCALKSRSKTLKARRMLKLLKLVIKKLSSVSIISTVYLDDILVWKNSSRNIGNKITEPCGSY